MSQKHLPNLDGLRTLAAFSVVFGHCNHFSSFPIAADSSLQWVKHLFFEQAHLGVEFFFVLSGFLISRIVLRQGRFDLGHFWLRRVLRIWPVYFLVVALGGLAATSGWEVFAMTHNRWPLLLTFLENFDLIALLKQHLPYGMIVSVLWSVSIEEQFYLIYPIVLLLVPRRYYVGLFSAIVAAALAFKVLHSDGPDGGFHTFSHCYELGIGCLLAMLLPQAPGWASRVPPVLLVLPYALSLLIVLTPESLHLAYLQPWLFALILVDQAYCPQSWLQTRRLPLLNSLGKITYGLYSYHMILAILVFQGMRAQGTMPHTLPTFALYVSLVSLLAVAVSLASYRWLERPILALSRRDSTEGIPHSEERPAHE